MGSSWRSPTTTHRRASNTKRKFRNFPKYSTQAGAAQTQASPLCEPPRRLQWLRQELDLWNEAAGDRPMPQPQDFGLNLPDLKPSEVHWRAAS